MIKRWIILTTLIIGLAFGSFGHPPSAPDKQVAAQAYILAGGDWADICGDGTDPLAEAATCLACVINHGCALPPNSTGAIRTAQSIALAWEVQDQAVQTLHSLQSHTARAPPFI